MQPLQIYRMHNGIKTAAWMQQMIWRIFARENCALQFTWSGQNCSVITATNEKMDIAANITGWYCRVVTKITSWTSVLLYLLPLISPETFCASEWIYRNPDSPILSKHSEFSEAVSLLPVPRRKALSPDTLSKKMQSLPSISLSIFPEVQEKISHPGSEIEIRYDECGHHENKPLWQQSTTGCFWSLSRYTTTRITKQITGMAAIGRNLCMPFPSPAFNAVVEANIPAALISQKAISSGKRRWCVASELLVGSTTLGSDNACNQIRLTDLLPLSRSFGKFSCRRALCVIKSLNPVTSRIKIRLTVRKLVSEFRLTILYSDPNSQQEIHDRFSALDAAHEVSHRLQWVLN